MRSMAAGAEVLHSDLASTRIFYLSQVVTARQVILVTHSKPCDRSIIGPGDSALTRPFEPQRSHAEHPHLREPPHRYVSRREAVGYRENR